MSISHRFPASDDFIAWAHSLSGMLAKMHTRYGTIAEMIEHPEWDESQTEYAISIIKSLCEHLNQIDEELSSHVNEKFGSQPR